MASGDVTLSYASAAEITFASAPLNLADNTLGEFSAEVVPAAPVTDILLGLKFNTKTGALQTSPSVALYAVGAADDDNYPPEGDRDVMQLVGRPVKVAVANTIQYASLFSLAAAFGGVLPPKFKVAIYNDSGLALSSIANETEVYQIKVFVNQTP